MDSLKVAPTSYPVVRQRHRRLYDKYNCICGYTTTVFIQKIRDKNSVLTQNGWRRPHKVHIRIGIVRIHLPLHILRLTCRICHNLTYTSQQEGCTRCGSLFKAINELPGLERRIMRTRSGRKREKMAEVLGVQPSTIYQWTHQGFIPVIVGGLEPLEFDGKCGW